jgi:hypothetical protein
MNQKSNFITKISFVIFAIAFIISIILYFQPESKPLNWLSLETAMEQSKSSNKNIILYFYSRWNQSNRQIESLIFSVDSLRKKLNTDFILAGLDLSSPENIKIAKDDYLVEKMPVMMMLNKNGKEVNRIVNFSSPSALYYWLQDSSYKYIASWNDYNKAKQIAEKENKKILLLVEKNPYLTPYLNTIFSINKLQLYISQKFVPVMISKTCKEDRQQFPQFLPKSTSMFVPDFIYILNSDGSVKDSMVVSRFGKKTEDEIINNLDKMLSENNNP